MTGFPVNPRVTLTSIGSRLGLAGQPSYSETIGPSRLRRLALAGGMASLMTCRTRVCLSRIVVACCDPGGPSNWSDLAGAAPVPCSWRRPLKLVPSSWRTTPAGRDTASPFNLASLTVKPRIWPHPARRGQVFRIRVCSRRSTSGRQGRIRGRSCGGRISRRAWPGCILVFVDEPVASC